MRIFLLFLEKEKRLTKLYSHWKDDIFIVPDPCVGGKKVGSNQYTFSPA